MAVRASGTGNYLSRTGASSFGSATGANLTMCCWGKRKVDTNNFATLAYAAKSGGTFEYWLETSTGGDQLHYYELPATETDVTGPTLTVDTWFFVACTRANASQKIYWGTEAGGTLSTASATDTRTISAALDRMYLFDDIYAEGFNGELSLFRTWDSELSAAELDSEWRSLTPVKSGVLVDLRLVGTSTAGTDSSGNGYTFTKTGTLTDGGSDPTPPVVAATLEQEGFRFRNDDGSESAATWRQAQDTNDSIARSTNFRLRTLVNATNDPAAKAFQLEVRKAGSLDWRKVQ